MGTSLFAQMSTIPVNHDPIHLSDTGPAHADIVLQPIDRHVLFQPSDEIVRMLIIRVVETTAAISAMMEFSTQAFADV